MGRKRRFAYMKEALLWYTNIEEEHNENTENYIFWSYGQLQDKYKPSGLITNIYFLEAIEDVLPDFNIAENSTVGSYEHLKKLRTWLITIIFSGSWRTWDKRLCIKEASMFRNEALNRLGISEDELVGEWNDYCEENSLYGEEIYPNTEDTFEEIMRNETPFEVAACAFRSAWNPGEKWVQYDVYLRSCNCPDELMRDEFIEAFLAKGEKDE